MQRRLALPPWQRRKIQTIQGTAKARLLRQTGFLYGGREVRQYGRRQCGGKRGGRERGGRKQSAAPRQSFLGRGGAVRVPPVLRRRVRGGTKIYGRRKGSAHSLASVRAVVYNGGKDRIPPPVPLFLRRGRRKGEKAMIVQNITGLVGKTPLLRLAGVERAFGAKAEIVGKLESYNPTGSVKDRVALAMVEDMERRGALKAGGTVIEPTSGNTGIGLAAVCAVKGYTLILTMPETMSVERRKLIAAYGAKIVLTEGAKGMRGAIEEAERIHAETPGSVIAGQFENPANPAAHYASTAPELWEGCGGRLDLFVAGVGTGGTFTGCARYLKEKDARIRAVAVEPQGSPVLSGGKAGAHGLQGIGAGFVPAVLDVSLLDEVIPVADESAFAVCRILARADGVFAGITSGAAVWAAAQLACRPENAGKRIAVILPDTGARYLSGDVFSAQ